MTLGSAVAVLLVTPGRLVSRHSTRKKTRPVPDNFARSLTFIPTCAEHKDEFLTAKLEDLKANEENPDWNYSIRRVASRT